MSVSTKNPSSRLPRIGAIGIALPVACCWPARPQRSNRWRSAPSP